jgi:flagellar motor switch protein FliG
VLSHVEDIPGEVFKCCGDDALGNLSSSLCKAISELSSADVPDMHEVLGKLQEYHARFEDYGMQLLEQPIEVLQALLGEEDEEDCSEDEDAEEDDSLLEASRQCAGYANKRMRAS